MVRVTRAFPWASPWVRFWMVRHAGERTVRWIGWVVLAASDEGCAYSECSIIPRLSTVCGSFSSFVHQTCKRRDGAVRAPGSCVPRARVAVGGAIRSRWCARQRPQPDAFHEHGAAGCQAASRKHFLFHAHHNIHARHPLHAPTTAELNENRASIPRLSPSRSNRRARSMSRRALKIVHIFTHDTQRASKRRRSGLCRLQQSISPWRALKTAGKAPLTKLAPGSMSDTETTRLLSDEPQV